MCWLACLDILINAPNVQNNSSGSHVGDEAWPVLTPLFSWCVCGGGRERLVSFTMSLMCNFKRHGAINHLGLLFKKTPALQLSRL